MEDFFLLTLGYSCVFIHMHFLAQSVYLHFLYPSANSILCLSLTMYGMLCLQWIPALCCLSVTLKVLFFAATKVAALQQQPTDP